MKVRNIGIELDQGAGFSLVIRIRGISGPINITGYQFLGAMRETTSSPDPVVAEFEFEILNQSTNKGQVEWSLPLEASEDIVVSTSNALRQKRLTTPFTFDVKMRFPSGKVIRIIQGIISVSPEDTQESFS